MIHIRPPGRVLISKEVQLMTSHPYTALGLLIGLASGFAGAFGGFSAFIVVLVLGLVGVIVGRVADGELDLTDYLGGRNRDRLDR